MSELLLAVFVLLGVAVACAFVSRRVSAAAALVGSVLMVVVGIDAAGRWGSASIDLGTWLGFGNTTLRVDSLAGIFFGLIGVLGVAVSLRYIESPSRQTVTALHPALLLTLAVVVTADQAFVFLLGWEMLSVVIYLIASADRYRPGTLVAGYLTGGLNKISGAALLAAFGLLYGATHSFQFSAWQAANPSSHVRNAAFILLVAGFAAKIGIPPIQAALPASYQAAPAPAAATLSIALVAGFYGLWRLVFETLAPATLWWGESLLLIGCVTALLGILYAIAQDDMRRFLGFSSVEHTGITLLGFGTALFGQATGQPRLVAAGILAATLHVIAHALAKTLALLSVERIGETSGTYEMRPLGGLAHVLHRSATGLGMATVTLAALPPFGGFVSEWFTLEALLQGFRVDNTLARLLMALSAAALALTAGLGLLAFAKLFGSTMLGRARSRLPQMSEPGIGLGIGILTLCTLLLGAAAPWEIRLLGEALQPTLGFDPATTAITHPLVLGPVYPGFSVLAPTWLTIALPAYALTVAMIVKLTRPRPVRRAAPWVCGTSLPPALTQYTPAGYSNPIRVVLRSFYGFRRSVVPTTDGDSAPPNRYDLQTTMVALIEDHVYRPLTTTTLAVTAFGRKLQSGRLSSYLAYLLIVLLIVLALIPTLKS
jgi:formate hydrogenlyase subunit 3/multisubunit Na+/H+ antiporter MnhD subunit